MLDAIYAQSNAEPREYQLRICEKIFGYYANGIRSAIVNSPTGSGKTIMGLALARWLQKEYNIGIGWVAMRRNLLTQAAAANRNMNIGCEGVRFISMFDKHPPKEDELGRPIGLLVVDEAQHDAASSMANLHNTLKPRWILGMTATPYRTDRIKLCFDKVVQDIGIRQLIDQGYLSPYHHYTTPDWSVDTVVDTYLREPKKWGKSVIYWHKREDANECLARLLQAGVRAVTIYGDDRMEVREDRLAAFEKGKLDVLINMMILTEGWDSPALKTVFVRDSQKGPTIQMAGRVFRKYPTIEYKQVVQSKITSWPICRTAGPAESFLWMENDWRSYVRSPEIERVVAKATISLAQIETHMPEFIEKKNKQSAHRMLARPANMGWADPR